MKRNLTLAIVFSSFTIVFQAIPAYAQQAAKSSSEKVRLTVPAKSLTFVPYYFGRAQGIFAKEGVNLEIIPMRPPLGVTALVAGDLDYSAAAGAFDSRGNEGRTAANHYIYSNTLGSTCDRPAGHDPGANP